MADVTVWTTDTGTAFASSASHAAIADIAERVGGEARECAAGWSVWVTRGRAVLEPAARAVDALRRLGREVVALCEDADVWAVWP